MTVELLDPQSIGGALLDAWSALEKDAATPANPFFCRWFLQPAIVHLAEPRSVRLLTVWNDEGRLIGLAPVERGETYARLPLRHFATWRHIHAYNSAPLCAQGAEAEVYASLYAWIDTHPEGARFLRFNEHPLPHAHVALASLKKRPSAVEIETKRAALFRGRDFDEAYADGFSGKKRKELRRQWRRLAETGQLTLERFATEGDIARMAEAFIALELAGWKGHTEGVAPLGASEAESQFFREAMAGAAAARAVLCDVAAFDGKPIAMLFSLRCGATLSAYKITYDEAYAAFSPGVHVLVEAMRLMLADPTIALFDSCAREGHPVVDHLWRERLRVAHFNVSAASPVDRALFGAASHLGALHRALSAPKTRRSSEEETRHGGDAD